MAMVKLPRAFKFTPTDYEIIGYYLMPKVQDLPIPANTIITEESVYTLHPSSLDCKSSSSLYNIFYTYVHILSLTNYNYVMIFLINTFFLAFLIFDALSFILSFDCAQQYLFLSFIHAGNY